MKKLNGVFRFIVIAIVVFGVLAGFLVATTTVKVVSSTQGFAMDKITNGSRFLTSRCEDALTKDLILEDTTLVGYIPGVSDEDNIVNYYFGPEIEVGDYVNVEEVMVYSALAPAEMQTVRMLYLGEILIKGACLQ